MPESALPELALPELGRSATGLPEWLLEFGQMVQLRQVNRLIAQQVSAPVRTVPLGLEGWHQPIPLVWIPEWTRRRSAPHLAASSTRATGHQVRVSILSDSG